MARKPKTSVVSESLEDWEARDAMHTLMRAHEIGQNKGLLKRVRKHAGKYARDMSEQSRRAANLAKSGRISDRQMEKLERKSDY